MIYDLIIGIISSLAASGILYLIKRSLPKEPKVEKRFKRKTHKKRGVNWRKIRSELIELLILIGLVEGGMLIFLLLLSIYMLIFHPSEENITAYVVWVVSAVGIGTAILYYVGNYISEMRTENNFQDVIKHFVLGFGFCFILIFVSMWGEIDSIGWGFVLLTCIIMAMVGSLILNGIIFLIAYIVHIIEKKFFS